MQQTNASVRVQKLDEAKEVIAELEEQKGMELIGPRGALFRAGGTVDSGQAYRGHMEKAIGQTAGLAIEGGYDHIASEAAQIIRNPQASQANDD
jgi:hypothetical protein